MSKAITCLFYSTNAVLTRRIHDITTSNTKEYIFPSRRGYKLSLYYNNDNTTATLVKYHESVPVNLTNIEIERYSKLRLIDIIKY